MDPVQIDVDVVESVLLADGWHLVDGTSFDIHQSVDFIFEGKGYGNTQSIWFSFDEGARGVVSGPITSIIALSYQR